jgi:hypothetical protein
LLLPLLRTHKSGSAWTLRISGNRVARNLTHLRHIVIARGTGYKQVGFPRAASGPAGANSDIERQE